MPDTRLPLETTPDARHLEALKQLIPEAFPDGRLDVDRLRVTLGNPPEVTGPERFGLTWPGKRAAIGAVQQPATMTLYPDRRRSVEFDATRNAIVVGDNLEVLRLLQNSYHRQVKFIYIDPPYNTGNDFIYRDDFSQGRTEFEAASGQRTPAGDRLVANPRNNGRFHSNWLSMMHPRLSLARNLLHDEGVICISIDDNELVHLLAVMDEVFGEENRLAVVPLMCNPRGRVMDPHFAKCHEYVVVYAKSEGVRMIGELMDEEATADAFDQEDEGGRYRLPELRNTHRQFNRETRPRLWYPLYVDPQNGAVSLEKSERAEKVLPVWDRDEEGNQLEGCWTWGREKAEDYRSLLVGRQIGDRWKIYRKAYVSSGRGGGETPRTKPSTLWRDPDFYTDRGQEAFDALVPGRPFMSPKPVGLIHHLLNICSRPDDLILDFFAGSGTTAEAVYQANQEDGGTRRFILVQVPAAIEADSHAGRLGYRTIADVTLTRVAKAAEKIRNSGGSSGDLGFRVFTCDESNFRPWNPLPGNTPALAEQLSLYADHLVAGRSDADLLYELMLKGERLSVRGALGLPIPVIDVAGAQVHVVPCAAGQVMVCFTHPISLSILRALRDRSPKPQAIVVLDRAFEGRDADKANIALELHDRDIVFHTV